MTPNTVRYRGKELRVMGVKRTRLTEKTKRHNGTDYQNDVSVQVRVRTPGGMSTWVRLERCEVVS